MKKALNRIALVSGIFLSAVFIVIVVNQTVAVVDLAGRVHPVLGDGVLYGLLLIYALVLLVPVYLWVQLPRSLHPPESESSPGFARHCAELRRRLVRNPLLRDFEGDLAGREGLEAAIALLDRQANDVIRNRAAVVFLATAVFQSGRLDALFVLGSQARLVWQIAHVYAQRPGLGDLARLYLNVAVAALLAMELEEMDIAAQIEPIVTNLLGSSVLGAVPGVGTTTTILTTSLLDGTANAYLTLRVGVIARKYCGALIRPDRRLVRRSAAAEAAGMLGGIVMRSGQKVSRAVWEAARRRGKSTLERWNPFSRKGSRSPDDDPVNG